MRAMRIAKWGNSHAVRIPQELMDNVCMKVGQEIRMYNEGRRIIIEEAKQKPKSIKDLFKDYRGNYKPTEWDIEPVGKEVF